MKRFLIILTIIALITTCCVIFASCDSGEYVYDGILGEGYIKLGNFKKVTIDTKITGLTYSGEGKYAIIDTDDSGNKKIEIYIKVEGVEKTINAYINSDGNLIVESIYRFMK